MVSFKKCNNIIGTINENSNGPTTTAATTTTTSDATTSTAPTSEPEHELNCSLIPPGDITTQPGTKIVFNAPYDDKHTYHIKIINAGGRRIGWAIKTTNKKRLGADPEFGILDPMEAAVIAVSCESFQFDQEDTNNEDSVLFEWTNTPDGAAKQFRREWFQGDCMVRRKSLVVQYN